MKQIGHFIDGINVAGTSGRTADIVNLNTGEIQAQAGIFFKLCSKPKEIPPYGSMNGEL
ncbi:MAG: hypothetical protein JKY25_07075 [Robiginitomaculum sp.]|nr:hypothetical protein [Robiginitomaculum sp.]